MFLILICNSGIKLKYIYRCCSDTSISHLSSNAPIAISFVCMRPYQLTALPTTCKC